MRTTFREPAIAREARRAPTTRRGLLSAIGTGLFALGGGCLRFSGTGDPSTPTAGPATTGGDPAIEVLSLKRRTSTVESWAPFEVEVVIGNTGSGSGTFSGTIQRRSDNEWVDETVSFESTVPPGEVKTVTKRLIAAEPGDTVYRIEGHDVRTTVRVTRPTFTFGAEFRHPDDRYAVSIDRWETADTVEYRADSNTTKPLGFPSSENQFGFVWMTYSSGPPDMGMPLDVTVTGRDGTAYSMEEYPRYVDAKTFVGRFDGTYAIERGMTEGNGRPKEAWLPFVVPTTFELDRVLVSLGFVDPPGQAGWVPE